MSPYEKEYVDRFFSTTKPWFKAYTHISLSYFAVRQNNETLLLQAKLFLNTAPSTIPLLKVETSSVLAGHFDFAETDLSLRDFVDYLAEGKAISTPHGILAFPLSEGKTVSIYFDPIHQEGIAKGNRLSLLSISGESKHHFVNQTQFDWELKAATQPFDSLNELLSLLMLGGNQNGSANVVIVADHVAQIDTKPVINNSKFKPSVFLAKSLDPNKCQIGYRVLLHGKVVNRGSIPGDKLTWLEQENFLLGESWIEIPQGAVLHCVASYDGFAQHQSWIADPIHSQNARRVSIEAFDDRLEILRDYLFEEQKTRKSSRDFEFGVAWLLWMLGFSVSQIGGTERSSDAPDISATTPQGNFMVIECTTGLLKAENKLAKLVDRTEAVKKRLISSGNSHLKLLSIIVTAKTKEEVKADLDQAQKLGIFVVTQETLHDLMQQSIASPDPEAIFVNALDSVQPKLGWLDNLGGLVQRT